ncbi:hypothetical protein B9Z55_014378 [Caenorhabditis nigoni]|uniref:Uncharacterized protein n=1 Tax=Caenorhabditis nigoni TaxID=1611254 RepID=A0A2G5U5U6_9PELO|nr:hypothetical protein B9Z55_014378 [Caenorhabditis nigoni]
MIRVVNKWMLLALLIIILAAIAADTEDVELLEDGQSNVQFSEDAVEGIRRARAGRTNNKNGKKNNNKVGGPNPAGSPKSTTMTTTKAPLPAKTTTTAPAAPLPIQPTKVYEPPHEDLPEDFSCQNLGEKYKGCEYLCKQLASMGDPPKPAKEYRYLIGLVLIVTCTPTIIILYISTRRMKRELDELNKQVPPITDDINEKLKIAYAAALEVQAPKNPEKIEEIGEEVAGGPTESKQNKDAMRAKLLETQQNLQKLRTHAKKCVEEHKADAASSKFQKRGAIWIPNRPEIPPPAPLPENIQLDKVEWCSDLNEQWIIGSDVDDIELDSDYVMNPDSITTDDDESTKSKKSKKDSSTAPGIPTPVVPLAPPPAAPPAPAPPTAPQPAAPLKRFPSTPSAAAKQGK